jgi:hypothetical protein
MEESRQARTNGKKPATGLKGTPDPCHHLALTRGGPPARSGSNIQTLFAGERRQFRNRSFGLANRSTATYNVSLHHLHRKNPHDEFLQVERLRRSLTESIGDLVRGL